jgi:hypothetical protein
MSREQGWQILLVVCIPNAIGCPLGAEAVGCEVTRDMIESEAIGVNNLATFGCDDAHLQNGNIGGLGPAQRGSEKKPEQTGSKNT